MTGSSAPTVGFRSPEEAEAALRNRPQGGGGGAVIVDFDETLWLRNSTEEYLRSLRPRALGYLVLLALEVIRPWRFIGGRAGQHVYRDWIRTLVCTLVMPWSLWLWRRRVPELADGYANRDLLRMLSEGGIDRFRVATLGVDAIVRPLLRRIAPEAELYAAGTLWSGHRIRALGKRAWIEQHYGADSLQGAVVITDSEADADLLGACATPLLVRWPRAEYRPALSDSYVPFLYTQRAKRPGENYMLYGVVLEDWVLISLAFAWLMPSPILGAAALLLLHLGFWAVYEIGYVENDVQAARQEMRPKVADAAAAYAARVEPKAAWTACLLFTLAGATLMVLVNGPALRGWVPVERGALPAIAALAAVWLAFVAVSRAAYWLYNRLDVQSRGIFYVVLQLSRTFGYGLVATTTDAGVALLFSLVLARWLKYLAYRAFGKTMAEDQRFLTLLLFLILCVATCDARRPDFPLLQALTCAAWLAIYAKRRLLAFLNQARIVRLGSRGAARRAY